MVWLLLCVNFSVGGMQCWRSKSSMAFKRDLALQNIPLSKQQPFKTQPQVQNEDVPWSPQYHLPATRTNKRRTFSLQEVELDGWFLLLHIILKTCTSVIRVLYFISMFLDWRLKFFLTNSSIETLKFKMKLIWGLQSWTLVEWEFKT